MKRLLPKAVDCLLAQTYENYEILLVNDGSTDGSKELCDAYAEKYNKIRVIHKENGGLSSARNVGIENAKGEFIIFPDPDDWVESNYLKQLIDLHNEYDADVEVCGHFVDDEKKSVIHNANAEKRLFNREEALNILMRPDGFCGFAWNKLYHLDIIKKYQLQFDTELGMAQDLHFAFRYVCVSDKIAYNPAPTYHYFQHIGGVTNAKSPLTKRKISGLITYEKIAELAGDVYPRARKSAYSTIFNMSMHFIFIYNLTKMKDKALLKKLKLNLRKYKTFFFSDDRYSSSHRFLARICLFSPKLYYISKKLIKG
jgi:glycosyltransferase involved in cell wall biosynthesis